MYSIVFSTTRQWNPGDEFILKGIRNILDECGISYNPIIYNRHPDIRKNTCNRNGSFRAKAEEQYWGFVKSNICDNSIKAWDDWGFVDLVIVAGTPEWTTPRCDELYQMVIKYRLPIVFVGVDSYSKDISLVMKVLLKKNICFLVRNREICKNVVQYVSNVEYLPCPAVLSTRCCKNIKNVSRVGLIFQGNKDEITEIAGIDAETYEYQVRIFHRIIAKYPSLDFSIICHYVDEISMAKKEWNDCEVYYSYDSNDYEAIYNKFDLVIGCRIHGVGIAASLGIPSIPIVHDFRRGTIDGFVIDERLKKIEVGTPNDKVFSAIDYCVENISKLSKELIEHKQNVLLAYENIFKNKIIPNIKQHDYDYDLSEKSSGLNLDKLEYQCRVRFMYKNIIEVMQQVNKVIENRKIIFKGGGQHTREWLTFIPQNAEILGIIDKNQTVIDGYKLINDNRQIEEADYILISSWKHDKEMTEDILKICNKPEKIISLYDMLLVRGICMDNDVFFYIREIERMNNQRTGREI